MLVDIPDDVLEKGLELLLNMDKEANRFKYNQDCEDFNALCGSILLESCIRYKIERSK